MKKLPDCSSRPSKASGWRRCACSIASAPRLTPTPIRAVAGAARAAPHRRAWPRSRDWPSTTSLRSPGPSSAARSGGSAPAAISAREVMGEAAELRELRPSWTTSSGAGSASQPVRRPQLPVIAPSSSGAAISMSARSSRSTARLEPGRRGVPGELITDLSPNAPGARSGLAGSVIVCRVPVVVLDLEQVLHAVDRRAGHAQPPLRALAREREPARARAPAPGARRQPPIAVGEHEDRRRPRRSRPPGRCAPRAGHAFNLLARLAYQRCRAA